MAKRKKDSTSPFYLALAKAENDRAEAVDKPKELERWQARSNELKATNPPIADDNRAARLVVVVAPA